MNVVTRVCDRCKQEGEKSKGFYFPDAWRTATIRHPTRDAVTEHCHDLCSSCVISFWKWFDVKGGDDKSGT